MGNRKRKTCSRMIKRKALSAGGKMAKGIRNSAKALIIEDGRLLAVKMKEADNKMAKGRRITAGCAESRGSR